MAKRRAPKAQEEAERVERHIVRLRPLRTMFLLDAIQDRDSRPELLCAASALQVGTVLFHWLGGRILHDSLCFSEITLATAA